MSAALLTTEIPADPTGWLMSEKFDGFRCIWNGEEFISRQGKLFNAPKWFKAKMPNIRLDGELWMGRGTFNELVSVTRSKRGDWSGVKFMVFDVADHRMIVEDRIALIESIDFPSHVEKVKHLVCTGNDDLNTFELDIVSNGGEGAVIRRPKTKYRPGRCGDVVKVKRLVEDVNRPNQ